MKKVSNFIQTRERKKERKKGKERKINSKSSIVSFKKKKMKTQMNPTLACRRFTVHKPTADC